MDYQGINNSVRVKRPDGLVLGYGQSWKTREQAIRSLLEGRNRLWWVVLYIQGWRVYG